MRNTAGRAAGCSAWNSRTADSAEICNPIAINVVHPRRAGLCALDSIRLSSNMARYLLACDRHRRRPLFPLLRVPKTNENVTKGKGDGEQRPRAWCREFPG